MSDHVVIDVDVVAERPPMSRVLQYASVGWREHLSIGGSFSTSGPSSGGYSLPTPPYVRSPLPLEGDPLERVRAALDAHGVGIAVLDAGVAPALSGLANVVMAAEIAKATNDWLVAEWLDADERFRGSIVVGPRDGAAAAHEVRRVGADGRMSQVVFAFPPCLLGDRSLHPLFAAAEELGLPVNLHAGGAYVGSNPGATPTGFPTSEVEYRIDLAYGGIPHLVSAVFEGVFERFPGLRLILSGFGVAWLPSVLWRLDAAFDLGAIPPRKKLQRRPSEVVREHVRFTTRDLDATPAGLLDVLPLDDVRRLLVHSSGYPDGPSLDWDVLPEDVRRAVRFENAASTLRLPELRPAAADRLG